MVLTKDNLLRFIRENKYVLPSEVSNNFSTTTLVASAALSELVNQGQVGVTNLKIGSSPYYYDVAQREKLQELAEKHFSGNDYKIYQKIKEEKVLSDTQLSPAEKIAIGRIKDFAVPLEVRDIKFWVWYLFDLNDTRKQIEEVMDEGKKGVAEEVSSSKSLESPETGSGKDKENAKGDEKKEGAEDKTSSSEKKSESTPRKKVNEKKESNEEDKDSGEEKVEDFLKDTEFKIMDKIRKDNGIFYRVVLSFGGFRIFFDAMYFKKRVSEHEIIQFYISSLNPKMVFLNKKAAKMVKLEEKLDNLFLIEL